MIECFRFNLFNEGKRVIWIKVQTGLLVAIEVLTILYGGWSGDEVSSDWGKVPSTIPVLIFSLVYHDLAPGEQTQTIFLQVFSPFFFLSPICDCCCSSVCLPGRWSETNKSFCVDWWSGSPPSVACLGCNCLWPFIPGWSSCWPCWIAPQVILHSLLINVFIRLSWLANKMYMEWQYIIRVKWSGVSYMVQAFSLLAVGTSLIGTLLSFSEFLKEQLNNLNLQSRVSTRLDLQVTFGFLGVNLVSLV